MAGTKQIQIKPLTIYFYHTRLTSESYEEWKDLKFPGHLLYGMPLFEKNGIKSVMHKYRAFNSRWKLMLYSAKEILFCKEKYDILYGTSFRGIEILIFLRALGLYRKPIVIWHHTALKKSKSRLREAVSRFFYRGIDKMFFFDQKHIDESITTHKTSPEKFKLVHWGPDLRFYDGILREKGDIAKEASQQSQKEVLHQSQYYTNSINKNSTEDCLKNDYQQNHGFISTGKENRDMKTMIEAFDRTKADIDIYIAKRCGNLDYEKIINGIEHTDNINISFKEGVIPYELAKEVAKKRCIVICCLDFPYTVGLTTLVEAFGLGIPVICSKNPYFEMDIDKEDVGITVDYNDVDGWVKAINYIIDNPKEAEEMGRKGRKLAEQHFNLEIFAHEITDSFKEFADSTKQIKVH